MADDNQHGTPGTLPDASGAGTSAHPKVKKADAAKLPGGADFDVAGATSEDFDKHYEILERRAKLAALSTPPITAATLVPFTAAEPAAVGVPQPLSASDIVAVHPELGTRGFNAITWAAMETQGEHGGWQEQVGKPTDI